MNVTTQLLEDLLQHFCDYGSYWKCCAGSDFIRLYKFYCKSLDVEPILLDSTRSTHIKDCIKGRFDDRLLYHRVPAKFGNKWMATNCLFFIPECLVTDRLPFGGLLTQMAINEDDDKKVVTFVKSRWLKSFHMKQQKQEEDQ